jgi:ubiquinone/menaquinone biosynthesis C-methylase UbiE
MLKKPEGPMPEGRGEKPQREWSRIFEEDSTVYRLGKVHRSFFEKLTRSRYMSKILSHPTGAGRVLRILEAGCGSGKFSVSLAVAGHKVVAMDYTMQMLENTRDLTAVAEGYYGELEIALIQQDLNNLGFSDESFDIVFNEGVVEHWLDREARIFVLREMARVTKRWGTVVIFVPNGRHPLYHWWRWTRYPGYLGSPPMIRYDAASLANELAEVGVRIIATDGLQAFCTICQWPTHRLLQKLAAALDRFVPLPGFVRQKFGVNLVVVAQRV